MIKDARCVFVTGRRGSGKTTLVRRLAAGHRVICFDPIGQYAREFGWPLARSLTELHQHLVRDWRRKFSIAMTVPNDFVAQLHRLSVYLWEAQEPYERGRDRNKVLLIVEEANLSVPNRALPAELGGFQRLVLQGRHRGVEIIAVSQRPALVSTDFRSAVAETYVFGLGYEADQKCWGTRYAAEIGSLPTHHYLHLSDAGASRGRNSLPGVAPAPNRRKNA